ncbi:MAG TPA: beta-ketoacyl synthase N-terminal-like domain-containing protein, partial [Solirubrobacteraceae bacterium]|nr:beta-ketoacyl synthase N-terminal-like domain-containing protein [Solirubrobacteraceae bacterium]
MPEVNVEDFDLMGVGPPGAPDATVPIAASRAGAIGVINLEFTSDAAESREELNRLMALGKGRRGLLADACGDLLAALLQTGAGGVDVVLLGGPDAAAKATAVELVHAAGLQAHVVATDPATAALARDAGADAVIAKGVESGGWVGEESAFVLAQHLLGDGELPVWVQGGVGGHTAGACALAGAAGAVLDSQLLLARESPLGERARARMRRLDGSRTLCLGGALGAPVRLDERPGGDEPVAALAALERSLAVAEADPAPARAAWCDAVRGRVDWRADEGALAIGQDACIARALARRFVTVGGIVAGLRESAVEHLAAAARSASLGENAPLAASHGTRYPLVQGPMTRVSDTPRFAAAVADGGALPFLALALLPGTESKALLARTSAVMDGRSWGVGILGFVPPELRAEQIEAILEHRPPFALIAGGRPDQARALEDEGIATYLHVPSPGLLELYLKDGARRFVFEGRECGGHVGPRTSFVLWESMLETLLAALPAGEEASSLHILLAGGIHDPMSAAMAATAAGTLAERGARIGLLMGTAYLFTHEAVRDGAITATYQQAAISCDETVLLETGPGHTTRCLPSPFVDEFAAEKQCLLADDVPADDMRARLEAINLGRLRLAAKGVDRNPRFGSDPAAPKLTRRGKRRQWDEGMYMIGQVAALNDRACSIAELHERVATGGARCIATARPVGRSVEPAPAPADVAIVGMGCVLPGAAELGELWANILANADAITEVPAGRWDWRRYFDADRAAPDMIYSRWGGFVDDVAFDPLEFGMPPASLPSIEPFQLLGLLVARAALRDAGYAERPFARDRTSVIFGAGGGGADLAAGYTVRSSLPMLFGDDAVELTARLGDALPTWTEDSFAGILMNVTAGRIANRLDLGGLNYTVDAACASSLAAICLAVSHLQAGTTEMVVAGGVDAIQNPFGYLCFSKTQALSPNGRCRPFDADADGIAISEGFAAVVLKRLADAERDGDRIYAVIRGVGGASDGRDRSLTAPRPEGQMRALRRAYAQAGYSPASVGLIEAHGTGTAAGDRAELDALRSVLEASGARPQDTAIGSVKSNIGHTKATAGIAGVIKATLALHHRVLPPTIAGRPNPQVAAAASPLYVNTQARPWLQPGDGRPRRAGVSAFGFGGTDFHLALEAYGGNPVREHVPAVDRWPAELFVWRAESRREIRVALGELIDRLDAAGERARLIDAAHTVALAAPRERRAATLAFAAQSPADLRDKLRRACRLLDGQAEREHTPGDLHYSERPLADEGGVAFLFPGQGSQYVDMTRELAVIFPEVRETFERADSVLAARLDRPLSGFVFPPPVYDPDEQRRQQAELTETAIAQPALGATELALLGLLRRLGVEPDVTAGHSYGELVALAAAGVFDDAQLIALSEARGRFIGGCQPDEPGTMAAIDGPPGALQPLLADPQLVLANLNGPHQTVVSGARESVERAVAWCRERELGARLLAVACAFHSPAMVPARGRLADWLATCTIAPPRIPVYANTTAAAYPSDPPGIAASLADQLVSPVRFADQIEAMHAAGARLFVEVGPRSVLTGLARRILDGREHVCAATDHPGRPGLAQVLDCLAVLAAEGVAVDVAQLFCGRGARGLEPPAPRSATTWMLNGGRARALHEPPRSAPRPPVSVALAATPTSVTPANGATATELDASSTNRANRSHAAADGGVDPGADLRPTVTTTTEGHCDDDLTRERQADALACVSAPDVGADRMNDVMRRHQDVMRHFLETQRSVMLAYLAPQRSPVEELRPLAPQPSLPAMPMPAIERPSVSVPPPLAADVAPEPPQAAAADAAVSAQAEAAPEAHGNGHAERLTRQQLADALIGVVSDRTGFPREMLTMDADLEADLSLDSIKRVEIAGTMLQTLPVADGLTPDLEKITASRTLREIVEALEAALTPPNADPATGNGSAPRPFDRGPVDDAIGRSLPYAVPAAPAAAAGALAAGGVVVIVDDDAGVGIELERALQA